MPGQKNASRPARMMTIPASASHQHGKISSAFPDIAAHRSNIHRRACRRPRKVSVSSVGPGQKNARMPKAMAATPRRTAATVCASACSRVGPARCKARPGLSMCAGHRASSRIEFHCKTPANPLAHGLAVPRDGEEPIAPRAPPVMDARPQAEHESWDSGFLQSLADRFDVVLIEIRLHDLAAQGLYNGAKVSDRRLLADQDQGRSILVERLSKVVEPRVVERYFLPRPIGAPMEPPVAAPASAPPGPAIAPTRAPVAIPHPPPAPTALSSWARVHCGC